jgi:hypothetical protein
VEDDSTSARTSWSQQQIKMLIALYAEHESSMENTKIKKKNVWRKICDQMKNIGYNVTQQQVRNKWANLLNSHKQIRDNRKKTGSNRKTFQYFEQIEQIVHKRHDINPPFLAGSGVQNFLLLDSDSYKKVATVKYVVKPKPSNRVQIKRNDDADEESGIFGHDNLSHEQTAALFQPHRSHKRRGQAVPENSSNVEILEFLKDMNSDRKKQQEDKEKAHDKRAKERNDILRSILDKL